ncbi:MAG TPA: TQO small subunit DoxD [Ktedonobacterales bacterium]
MPTIKQPASRTRKVESTRRPEVAGPAAETTHPGAPESHSVVSVALDWRRAVGAVIPGWVFAPLRLFLGITFVYAGIQKLTDPQFFNPHAAGYIGKQIHAFAVGSPLRGLLLTTVAPHATVWGAVIAWGEMAIGLGALIGLLLRPASFFGALLSLIFFLSASWRVRPYFYGADIVFLFAWVTLLLAGPLAGALPALDSWLAPEVIRRAPAARRDQVARWVSVALGVAPEMQNVPTSSSAPQEPERAVAPAVRSRAGTRAAQRSRYAQSASRRDFIKGALVGGGVMLVASWLWSVTHPAATSGGAGGAGGTGSVGSTPGATSSATSEIASVQNVPVNSAASFTIPSSGDPGVLVHLESGRFVAFDATCTHAGCPVDYDSSSKLLLCPCHGAAFDPAQDASVVQGPAPTPLTPVSITVNQSSGAITLQ